MNYGELPLKNDFPMLTRPTKHLFVLVCRMSSSTCSTPFLKRTEVFEYLTNNPHIWKHLRDFGDAEQDFQQVNISASQLFELSKLDIFN